MSARTPNEAFRCVVQEAGCSYEPLARLVVRIAAENGDRALTSRSSIAHWISGITPSGRMPDYLAEALSRRIGRPITVSELGFGESARDDEAVAPFGPDPIGSLSDLGKADLDRSLDRRSVLFSAALLPLSVAWLTEADERAKRVREHGGIIGMAEIEGVRTVTEAFNRADETLGGGHGRAAVVQYLVTDVAGYCAGSFRRDDDRRAMFGAAAELAYLAGWKCHDVGAEGLAQQYYAKSLQLATESDPHGHAAWTLRILAHQSLDLNRPQPCIALATRAWDRARGWVDPATEAMFAISAARAYAANRYDKAAVQAVLAAEDLLARGDDSQMPHWAALTGPASATVASHIAKTFTALGDHGRAESRYLAAAAARNPAQFRRIHALNLAQAADAQASQGHADQACIGWATALACMHGVSSDRHRQAIVAMRNHLTTFKRRKVPGAAELDQHGVDLLAKMT